MLGLEFRPEHPGKSFVQHPQQSHQASQKSSNYRRRVNQAENASPPPTVRKRHTDKQHHAHPGLMAANGKHQDYRHHDQRPERQEPPCSRAPTLEPNCDDLLHNTSNALMLGYTQQQVETKRLAMPPLRAACKSRWGRPRGGFISPRNPPAPLLRLVMLTSSTKAAVPARTP